MSEAPIEFKINVEVEGFDLPEPNEHAHYYNKVGHVPAGACAYEMAQSRLGSAWHYCGQKASMRCVIRHGSDSNLLVEDYCTRHYRNAKRRTRYDVVVAEEVIG
jgi:hypothetical protein